MAEKHPIVRGSETTFINESLFPFSPEAVTEGLANLQNSSNQMLDMVTFARGPRGAADELYTNLPFGDLIAWHKANKDFTQNGSLLYRAGMLYGIDLSLRIAAETDIAPVMKFVDPVTFDNAIRYVKESYRGLDDEQPKPEWQRQKEREMLYTGSDILTLANATLDDTVRSRFLQMGHGYHQDELAQHVGIIDGAIFVDALRAFRKGTAPQRFEKPQKEYVPTYDPNKHVRRDYSDLAGRYEFENINELLSLAKNGADAEKKQHVADIHGGELNGVKISGTDRFVQVGINAFATAVEIDEVIIPNISKKKVGAIALVGLAVDTAYMIAARDLPYANVPVATIMNTVIGITIERSRLKRIQKSIDKNGVAALIRTYDIS